MIIAVQGSVTMAELLEHKQRTMVVWRVRDVVPIPGEHYFHGANVPVRKGFPSVGAADVGYEQPFAGDVNTFKDGRLSVGVKQRVEPGKHVKWTVHVDLRQVILREKGEDLVIPATAVTVETNVREHMDLLNLAPARVAEMEMFKLTARFELGGKYIRFDAVGAGQDGALGFELGINCPWLYGKSLDGHAGLKVGDRVRITDPFAMYKPFAVGQEGVIREIRMFKYAVYYVEVVDTAIRAMVKSVHKNGKALLEGRVEGWCACRRFQIDPDLLPLQNFVGQTLKQLVGTWTHQRNSSSLLSRRRRGHAHESNSHDTVNVVELVSNV